MKAQKQVGFAVQLGLAAIGFGQCRMVNMVKLPIGLLQSC